MNEMLESWSLPWHTLQRSLAQARGGVGAEGPAVVNFKSLANARTSAAAAGSWLARARDAAPRALQSAR